MIPSSSIWTPLFLYAEPHITGNRLHAIVSRLIVRLISSSVSSPPSRNFSMSSSSHSATVSSISSLHFFASSSIFSGMDSSSMTLPRSSSYISAFILIRSMMPIKESSAPIGSWTTTGVTFSLSLIICTTLKKSAPSTSILLMKIILGTPYLAACLQTVSD